jgi:hypothetical protein
MHLAFVGCHGNPVYLDTDLRKRYLVTDIPNMLEVSMGGSYRCIYYIFNFVIFQKSRGGVAWLAPHLMSGLPNDHILGSMAYKTTGFCTVSETGSASVLA